MKYTLTVLGKNEDSDKRLSRVVSDFAKITNQRQIGERQLAYPIGDSKLAHFFQIEIETDDVKNLKETLSQEKDLIRFLLVKEAIISEKERQSQAESEKEERVKRSDKPVVSSRIISVKTKPKSFKNAKPAKKLSARKPASATDKKALDKKLAEIIKE